MKKFMILVATAFVLCIPAFADYDSYFASSVSSPIGSFSGIDSDVYIGLSYVNGGSNINVYAFSSLSGHTAQTYNNNLVSIDSYDSASGVYYKQLAYMSLNDDNFVPNLTKFANGTSISDICSAYLSFLNSVNPPINPVSSSFTLPRGNVLYFQVDSAQDVKLTSYMDSLSSIINFNSATFGPWGDTGQRFGPAAALPTSGTTFPLASQSPIHWNKDASQNVLGQTKIGRKNVSCIVGQWYCFYNPNANHIEGADPYNALPGASVLFEGSFSQIKVYPVNQKLSVVDGDLYSSSNDDFESYYDGTVDNDGTVTWTNQDGNIGAPAAGGQNFEDGPKSATSLLEGIRITLETVVHELQTLFTFGYSAIQSLVGIMSDFVSVFSGLYTWLPAEVYSALMSAVVVAIVIGVFKVFL